MERIIFLCLLLIGFTSSAQLPKGLKRCSISDPKVDDCFKNAVTHAFKFFKDGSRELGVPPIDPIELPELKIEDTSGKRPLSFNMYYKDLRLHGFSDFTVNSQYIDWKNPTLYANSTVKKFWIESKYQTKGKILLIPLSGKGDCKITMEDVSIRTVLKFKEVMKKGEKYWDVQDASLGIEPKKGVFYFENLVSATDQTLNEGILTFLNNNWKIIFEEVGPWYEEAFGLLLKSVAKRVFSKVPFDSIFLP